MCCHQLLDIWNEQQNYFMYIFMYDYVLYTSEDNSMGVTSLVNVICFKINTIA